MAKKNRKDRKDAYFIEDKDPIHSLMPYMLPNRTDNEAVLSETVDMTEVVKYIEKKNADNPEFKYTFFHFITAVIGKTIALRPHMNRYYSGYRLYERKEIILTFVVKKMFTDNSAETIARVYIDRDSDLSPIEQVHSQLEKIIYSVRKEKKQDSMTDKMDILLKLPRWLMKIVIGVMRRMQENGTYPLSLQKDDPYYASVFISNLGSIKMNADYHHIANWGTNSFFVTIGEKKPMLFAKADGTVEVKDGLKLGLTIDERIADGYYFSKSLKLMRKLFENPELIDEKVMSEIDY
ncbi:MAG: 2-oxo acid dehydrogenase subunit E2 [Firmicutes bacterium]|nr:2-oxo acid dehydrogenase subunit E2 [Candidatus Colimorpha enterica]